jgi:DNA repair ATPase RecN
MIKNLKIINFQSHHNSELYFDRGLNVIIGKSDSGKTAILRALNKVINNRPVGDGFITHDKNKCEIKLDDITRIKSKKENSYVVNEKVLKAFGTEPPQEVKELLNFNELNIQFQLEAPFLLSQSSGEVARFLNKIINLDIIDISLKNIESTKRKFKNEFERKENEEKELQEEIKNYDWIEEFEIKLKELNNKQEIILSKTAKISEIKEKNIQYKENLKQIKNFGKKLLFEAQINKLIDLNNKIKEKEQKIKKIKEKIQLFNENNRILNDLSKKVSYEKKIKELTDFFNKKLFVKSEKYSIIKSNMVELENSKNKIFSVSNQISKLSKKLKKEIGENCPLCNQVIPSNQSI